MTPSELLLQYEQQRERDAERWYFGDDSEEVDEDTKANLAFDARRDDQLYDRLYGGGRDA